MPMDMFQKYLCDVELKPTNTILKTYNGESIRPVGKAQIHGKLQMQKKVPSAVCCERGKECPTWLIMTQKHKLN